MRRALIWIVCGALAACGVFWIALQPLKALGHLVAIATGAALVGGFAAGAMIVKHAAVRPLREPLIAGALGLAIALGMLASMPPAYGHVEVGWYLWPTLIAAGGAGGAAGAALLRRFVSTNATRRSVLLSSMAINIGVLLLGVLTAERLAPGSSGASIAAVFAGTAVAGFLVQVAAPGSNPWVCASGTLVFPLIVAAGGAGFSVVAVAFVGFAVLLLVSRVGSAIARHFIVGDELPPELPSAQLRGP